MPKRVPCLTDEIISNATPKEKDYKLSDGGGLHLLITTTGSKLWRYSYRFQGKSKSLALKSYPARSIADARNDLIEAKLLLSKGIDPSTAFKEQNRIERAAENTSIPQTVSVRVGMDGTIDIWKGRFVVRLGTEEACFVKNQLCKLLDD